ncbi:MAG: hypothetical protein JXQ72_03260 [Anaerolineae bacterium]|nr:hypothetical protein [Anaerolineae bacterium]
MAGCDPQVFECKPDRFLAKLDVLRCTTNVVPTTRGSSGLIVLILLSWALSAPWR